MNDTAYEQLTVIRAVTGALETAGISAWLFGGWGLDARIGRITRDHGDVEFWVERVDAERSKTALITAGATALTTQPPTEDQYPKLRNGLERELQRLDQNVHRPTTLRRHRRPAHPQRHHHQDRHPVLPPRPHHSREGRFTVRSGR